MDHYRKANYTSEYDFVLNQSRIRAIQNIRDQSKKRIGEDILDNFTQCNNQLLALRNSSMGPIPMNITDTEKAIEMIRRIYILFNVVHINGFLVNCSKNKTIGGGSHIFILRNLNDITSITLSTLETLTPIRGCDQAKAVRFQDDYKDLARCLRYYISKECNHSVFTLLDYMNTRPIDKDNSFDIKGFYGLIRSYQIHLKKKKNDICVCSKCLSNRNKPMENISQAMMNAMVSEDEYRAQEQSFKQPVFGQDFKPNMDLREVHHDYNHNLHHMSNQVSRNKPPINKPTNGSSSETSSITSGYSFSSVSSVSADSADSVVSSGTGNESDTVPVTVVVNTTETAKVQPEPIQQSSTPSNDTVVSEGELLDAPSEQETVCNPETSFSKMSLNNNNIAPGLHLLKSLQSNNNSDHNKVNNRSETRQPNYWFPMGKINETQQITNNMKRDIELDNKNNNTMVYRVHHGNQSSTDQKGQSDNKGFNNTYTKPKPHGYTDYNDNGYNNPFYTKKSYDNGRRNQKQPYNHYDTYHGIPKQAGNGHAPIPNYKNTKDSEYIVPVQRPRSQSFNKPKCFTENATALEIMKGRIEEACPGELSKYNSEEQKKLYNILANSLPNLSYQDNRKSKDLTKAIMTTHSWEFKSGLVKQASKDKLNESNEVTVSSTTHDVTKVSELSEVSDSPVDDTPPEIDLSNGLGTGIGTGSITCVGTITEENLIDSLRNLIPLINVKAIRTIDYYCPDITS